MKVKIVTAIYSDLYGTEFGGRSNRLGHYNYSLLSLLKMKNAEFLCYTSQRELSRLEDFFYRENLISKKQLQIKVFELTETPFRDLILKYKNVEKTKMSDRCIEIQYMKFVWPLLEDIDCDYIYWFDAGISHCGLIPVKYRSVNGIHNSQYYESCLFNNTMLSNLINKCGDKFTIIAKENIRNFWSGTVDHTHFNKHDPSQHVIGGIFGGKKELWHTIGDLFVKYLYQVTEHDLRLYHEEDIMTLMFRNHPDMFAPLEFDTWWHENERMPGIDDMVEFLKQNKSFYKIIEELNDLTIV